MSYRTVLPQVFEYQVSVPISVAREAVGFLVHNPVQESSFAVTVDSSKGRWNLWLSKTSYEELERAGIL